MLMIFRPAMFNNNHSILDSSGDQLDTVQDRLSWKNVARLPFLLGVDPTGTRFGITSYKHKCNGSPGGGW